MHRDRHDTDAYDNVDRISLTVGIGGLIRVVDVGTEFTGRGAAGTGWMSMAMRCATRTRGGAIRGDAS